mgnify:CR=1 FL=1
MLVISGRNGRDTLGALGGHRCGSLGIAGRIGALRHTGSRAEWFSLASYEGVDAIRYRFTFDTAFPAYRREEDGQNVLTTADYIDFAPNVAIAQLINCLPELADLHVDARERAIRQGVSGGISAAQLQILCRGAKFTIERTQFAAGDPYKTFDGKDAIHEHDGFSTSIREIKLLDKQVKLLENMQMQLLMNQL